MSVDDRAPIGDPHGRHPAAASLDALWPHLGQPIAFYRRLVGLTGGVKAALLLGQMLYWTRNGRDVDSRQGWFYKTAAQWCRETGLTRREQIAVRRALVRRALLEEQRAGIPATIHFRVNLARLERGLDALAGQRADERAASSGDRIAEALGRPMAFYPRLVTLTHSINMALLLSRTLGLTRHGRADAMGWIRKPGAAWTRELGLPLSQYRHACRRLCELGVLHTVLRGVPATSALRVDLGALLERLSRVEGADADRCGLADPRSLPVQNVQSSLTQSAQLDARKPPDQIEPTLETGLAQTAKLNKYLITSYGLQTPPADTVAGRSRSADSGGVPSLVFPVGLDAEQQRSARAMLTDVPELAQDLLDELAARLAMNAVRVSPIAYLRTLTERAKSGTFVVEAGAEVRGQRRKRERDEAALHALHEEVEAAQALRKSPQYEETIARRREDMRRFLAQSRRSAAGVTKGEET